MPYLGRLLSVYFLIVHNLDIAECNWQYISAKNTHYDEVNTFLDTPSSSNYKLDKKVIDPKASFGFLTLNKTYNKYESPGMKEVKVQVQMEPTFVTEIDSIGRKMGLEIKLGVTWEDARIWWRKDNITSPGDLFTFEPQILK